MRRLCSGHTMRFSYLNPVIPLTYCLKLDTSTVYVESRVKESSTRASNSALGAMLNSGPFRRFSPETSVHSLNLLKNTTLPSKVHPRPRPQTMTAQRHSLVIGCQSLLVSGPKVRMAESLRATLSPFFPKGASYENSDLHQFDGV